MKNVDHILIAIMFSEPLPQNFSYFSLTAQFKEKFNDIFETTDPIPAGQGNIPPEVPRYILQTNDLNYDFSFSGIRFDYNFNNISDFEIDLLDKYISKIKEVLDTINLPLFRIGIVIDGIIVPKIGIENYLKQFINVENLNHSIEYQVSYREIINNDGYNYNKWIRYGGLKNNNIINFQLDVNSANGISTQQLYSAYNEVIKKEIGDCIDR